MSTFFSLIRRCTLLAAVAAVICCISSCSGRKTIYATASGDNDLIALLHDSGFEIVSEPNVMALLEQAPDEATVLLLNPNYPDSVTRLTPDVLSLIDGKRLRVYAEYASPDDTIPLPRKIEFERVVVIDSLSPDLLPMNLLSINRGWFIPQAVSNPLMVVARVAGFETAAYGLEGTPAHPLVYRPSDNLWVTTSKLSDFSRLRFTPAHRWKSFWETLISDLTGSEVTFASWPTLITPSYGRDDVLPDSARLASVRKGVQWFFNGHFLVDSTWKAEWLDHYQGDGLMPVGPALPDSVADGDGSLGILEGHCSAIYGDGTQSYRYWMRDDVQGEASMTFAIAGKLLGNDNYMDISRRLVDYSFDEFRDGPRNDPKSPSYGLLGWAQTHKHVYYGDDNARSILGMIVAADLLGDSKWDDKIVEAILGNFRTTGRFGFRGERLEDQDIQKNGLDFYRNRDLVSPHPHFESWMWACYLWLYRQTGYQPLLDMAESGIARTIEAYPDKWRWTNGLQQEKARMILPLAWLYRVSPTDQHRQWLDTMVDEVLKSQVECGAIREQLGDPANGLFGRVPSNEAYGTNESPLIFDNGDPIADMLYTCNFAFFGLNEAARATDDPKIINATQQLSDFLTRIQASSDSIRNVDGAWFRAFNYKNWDYWASDADAGWGALSTLTGWIQSWIVSTQALMEMNTSYWELTDDSSIGKSQSEIFSRMLKN